MAERKAVNKYYPPDWDPSKGSVNKHVGQHPLRERARKLSEGILIIRFEMPFNIWCLGCNSHIARGVRFNAEKKEIGKYHSTPILSFRMKCHLCSNWMEIHTDPKNSEYVVVEGARKKMEDRDSASNETIAAKSKEEAEKLLYNPFYKVEHKVEDQEKAKEVLPRLQAIQTIQEGLWKEDYEVAAAARKKFRKIRDDDHEQRRIAEELRKKRSINLPLLPETSEDIAKAKSTQFGDKKRTQSILNMQRSSIFSKSVGQPPSRPVTAPSTGRLVESLDFTKSILPPSTRGKPPNAGLRRR